MRKKYPFALPYSISSKAEEKKWKRSEDIFLDENIVESTTIREFNHSLRHFLKFPFWGNAKCVQVSLVICNRYVPSFWTANPEFAEKKSIFS
jgi:hypothetical protein